jgi:hypothetical protein
MTGLLQPLLVSSLLSAPTNDESRYLALAHISITLRSKHSHRLYLIFSFVNNSYLHIPAAHFDSWTGTGPSSPPTPPAGRHYPSFILSSSSSSRQDLVYITRLIIPHFAIIFHIRRLLGTVESKQEEEKEGGEK